MSTTTDFIDTINPATGATFSINGVSFSNVAPSTNQLLTATSPTAANWQTAVSALKTTTTPVNVSASAQPGGAGETLVATSSTTATWQTVSFDTFVVASVRASTVQNGTLASDFENGDTIDGITLATGDRILIKDQTTAIENGVYTVNASGAPTRATDFQTGTSVSGFYLFSKEGTQNSNLGFLCTNVPGNDVVNTNNLTFAIFDNAGSVLRVSSIQALTNALTTGVKKIVILPGVYNVTSTISITGSNIEINGFQNSATILRATNPLTSFIFNINGASDLTIRNIEFDGDESNVTTSADLVDINNSASNIKIENCRFTRIAATIVRALHSSECSGLRILKCNFLNSPAGTSNFGIRLDLNNENVYIINCKFQDNLNEGIRHQDTAVGGNVVNISRCTFTNNGIGITLAGSTAMQTIISGCIFDGVVTGIDAITEQAIINSCSFSNNTGTSSVQASVRINQANTILDSNSFLNNAGDAIKISSTTPADVIVINNIITSSGGYGIVNTNTSVTERSLIEGNSISDNQSGNFIIPFISTRIEDYIKHNLARETRTSAITGTVVDTTNGLATLIGTGTNFLSTVKPGDILSQLFIGSRTVVSVDSDTQLTMNSNYTVTQTVNISALDFTFALSGYDSTYLLTSSANVNSTTANLSDLVSGSADQTVYVELDVFATSVVLTATTSDNNLISGAAWSTVTLNGAGDNVTLRWIGPSSGTTAGWDVIDFSGGTIVA